jgi:alpha-beta hydrolase superfamily lysophospholipase
VAGAPGAAAGPALAAADGVALHVHDWPVPPGVARRGSLLLVHGLGEHAGRYAHVAAALAAGGIAVRGWDQRGFGRSGGARGAIPHPDALLDDARLLYDRLAADAQAAGDDAPPFLLGHSMGGVVAARAATGGWIAPRGLVLSSPALRARLSAAQRVQLALGRRLLPNVAVSNALPVDLLSHDPATLAAYRADASVHDRVTPRLAAFIIDAGAQALRDAPRLRVPTLLLVAGSDGIVDAGGARDFAAALPDGVGTLRWYDALYHELFNEREPDRARVLADLRRWITAQLDGAAGA